MKNIGIFFKHIEIFLKTLEYPLKKLEFKKNLNRLNYHTIKVFLETPCVKVWAGLGHQAALTDTGDLYIWGKNRSCCLGLGDHFDQFFPLKVSIGAGLYKRQNFEYQRYGK